MSLNAETASIYLALGLRENQRLPDGGIVPRIAPITGWNGIVRYHWNVRLAPKAWGKIQRVEAQCPHCSRWFSAGNLSQHIYGFHTRKGKVEGCRRAD